MRTCKRRQSFLILFILFSVSFFASSATGQTLPVVGGAYQGQPGLPVVGGAYQGQPGLPVVGGAYQGQPGLPVVGGVYQGQPISPGDNPVEAAKRRREEAERILEVARAAKLEAEQKLADAETALEKAKADEKAAIDDRNQIVITYKNELKVAEQQFNKADAAFMAATRDLQELEQKLASARAEVTENETAKQGAEQALRQAENEVRRIKGEPELPVVGGSYMGQPDGTPLQLLRLQLAEIQADCRKKSKEYTDRYCGDLKPGEPCKMPAEVPRWQTECRKKEESIVIKIQALSGKEIKRQKLG
jgi:hypothetical protein